MYEILAKLERKFNVKQDEGSEAIISEKTHQHFICTTFDDTLHELDKIVKSKYAPVQHQSEN